MDHWLGFFVLFFVFNRQLICWNIDFRPSFPGGSLVKNPPAIQKTRVQPVGQEDMLEKKMAIYSGTLAWEIPGERSLEGRLQFMESRGHKESDMT